MGVYSGQRRGDLLQLNLPDLRRFVQSTLATYPEVAGAYLFGSALEFVRSTSDIDLGLIVRPGVEAPECLANRVESTLGHYGPHPFQVTLLRPEETSFTFRVLRDGNLVYLADPLYVTDLIEAVGRKHDDLAPFLHTFYVALGVNL